MATRKASISEKEKCGKCEKKCTENSKSLTCDLCGFWHHTKCEGVSDNTYETIQTGAQGIRWYCRKCDSFAGGLLANIKQITRRQDILELKVDNIETSVQKKLEEQDRKIEKVLHDSKQIEETVKTRETAPIQNSVKEIDDRMSRKRNIVFYGVAESQSTESEIRKREDTEKAIHIIENGLHSEGEIENCRRLGGKKAETSRPLLVRLKSQDQAEKCLRSWRTMKENEDFKTIAMKRDMTFLERQEMKKLVEERNRRREQTQEDGGSEVWAIRNGKVINTARREEIRENQTEENQEETANKGQKPEHWG